MNTNMNMVMSMNKRSFDHSHQNDTLKARVLDSLSSWVNAKVKESPGCIERFVCEAFKTGETLEGLSYLLMAVSK